MVDEEHCVRGVVDSVESELLDLVDSERARTVLYRRDIDFRNDEISGRDLLSRVFADDLLCESLAHGLDTITSEARVSRMCQSLKVTLRNR